MIPLFHTVREKNMKLLNFLIAFGFSVSVLAGSQTPVMVGGDENVDACMTLGAIKNTLGEVGVYSSPDESSEVIDKLKGGTRMMLCDSGNGWTGVVYSGDHEPYCGVTSPIETRQPYKGECKSGWIKSSVIEVLAG